MKRVIMLFVLCVIVLLCSSCAEKRDEELPTIEDYDIQVEQKERSHLKLGIVTGPYGDMFTEIMEPLFSQRGYTVEFVIYDNYNEPNFALASGEIDFNMFQNYKYLNNFKFENGLDLSAIAEIPTATMGIYSYQYRSIDDLKEGATVAIPSDSTNLARALTVLADAGIVSIDLSVDITRITLNNITQNPANLQFVLVEAHLLIEALKDYDLAVINGNFAITGGLNISNALFNESLSDHAYLNVIAVRTEDLGEPFVMDLIDVLRSDEFKSEIIDVNGKYSDFQYPCNFR